MRRLVGWTLVLLALTIPAVGCSSSKKSAPVQAPSASTPSAPAGAKAPELPGDRTALQAALAEKSPVQYEIVLVNDAVTDKDAMLDSLLAEKSWPDKSMLVLVVFTKDNFDARFAMGAIFNEKKVGAPELYTLLKSEYFPKAKENDPAGGLAAFVKAINKRIAQ